MGLFLALRAFDPVQDFVSLIDSWPNLLFDGSLPDVAENLNTDAMAVLAVIRNEAQASGKCSLPLARIADRARLSVYECLPLLHNAKNSR